MRSSLMEKYGNVRFLGMLFFVLASIFCLYKIYDLRGKPSDAYKRPTFTNNLKLVSIIARHGDRAPSDKLPKGDKHADKINFFWPNGMSELTDAGQMRQFRIGLELRRRYGDFLSYNASHFLAFSSPVTRCQESINHTLRGLFNIEWTSEMGRRLVDLYNAEKNANCSLGAKSCPAKSSGTNQALILPTGSGSPTEYKNISIDLTTVPVLTWEYLEQCRYRKDHPTSVDKDLMTSKAIAELKGIKRFSDLFKRQYELNFNFSVLPHWATIDDETRLARTRDSMAYGAHYFNWINERPPEYTKSKVTYFDLFEQLAVFGFRDRIEGTADFIQVGPIVTSIIQSQKAALERKNDTSHKQLSPSKASGTEDRKFDSPELYKDKKMVFYSTHDSILHLIMDRLNMTYIDSGDFETRFNKWHRADDVSKFLAGFKMPEFGASLAFELYEMEKKEKDKGNTMKTVKRFSYVQAALYNEEEGKYRPIEYKRLKLGSMCKQKFERIRQVKQGGRTSHSLLDQFYDDDFPLDKDFSCPFELFKNITSDYMIQPQKLVELCNSN